ncbi:hypothetical protein BDN67DRAFT_1015279 [Paxillus ammoniavirescens]|nr:hypothetical protein BDN67DRAFT_1015279 [Paxillus ammoniavirescens]
MSRSEHVDHINHDMWQGDTVFRNCNLESAWLDSRAAALSILSASLLWEEEYDFNTIFSIKGVDMLCPFGGGNHPSINHEDNGEDRSIIMLLESEVPPQVPAQTSDDDITAEEELTLTFKDQLESELANGIIDEDLPTPLSLINPESSTDSSPPPPPSGKDFSAKSHDWLLCIRGFTPVNKLSKTPQSLSTSNTDLSFIVGSPFITLIRLDDHTTSLVLVCSTNIHENGVSHNDINIRTLQENSSKIKISGNVLLLVPSKSSELEFSWIWTGAYLKTASTVPGLEVTTQKVVEVSTTGSLMELINPDMVSASTHLGDEKRKEINKHDLTWSLSHKPLQAAVNQIWTWILERKIPVSDVALVRLNVSEELPYRLKDGSPGLCCDGVTSQLLNTNLVTIICPRCTESTDDIRSHMGGHILQAVRGIKEALISPVAHLSQCGFCGHSQVEHLNCMVKLKVTSTRGVEMHTDCSSMVRIKFTYADKGLKKQPCHNVPVISAIWRYNMEQHFNFTHPEYAHPGKLLGLPLPSNIIPSIVVDSREEAKFGVPLRPQFTHIQIFGEHDEAEPAHEKRRTTNANGIATQAGSSKRLRTK